MRLRLPPLLLAPVVAAALLATTGGGVAAAEVPSVAAAQATVADLNAEVARTTAELSAGTQRYEQGQAVLADTQAKAAAARAQADLALAEAAAAKAHLARVVNAAYRTPRPDALTLALGAQPGRLEEAVVADAALEHIQGNQEDALAAATAEGERARGLADAADALQAQAAEAQDLEAQVAALQAEAEATRVKLEAAAAALEAAQAAAAATAAAAAAAAGATADASGGGATCQGVPTTGYPNGFLPAAALCPLTVGNGHRLRADAAAAFNAMYAAHPLCVTDSYRTLASQVRLKARKPGAGRAARHEQPRVGRALDLCDGVNSFGTGSTVDAAQRAGLRVVPPGLGAPGRRQARAVALGASRARSSAPGAPRRDGVPAPFHLSCPVRTPAVALRTRSTSAGSYPLDGHRAVPRTSAVPAGWLRHGWRRAGWQRTSRGPARHPFHPAVRFVPSRRPRSCPTDLSSPRWVAAPRVAA